MTRASSSEKSRTALILLASFASGACLFGYEIAWSRLVTLMVNGTAFSFSTMLSTVLAGLAIGSLFATRLQSRRDPRLWWLVTIFAATGATVLPLFAAVESWPFLAVMVRAVVGDSPARS
jgi:predicted membrane-bound spermidine synthase